MLIRKAELEDLRALNKLNNIGLSKWKAELWDSRMQPSFGFVSQGESHLNGVECYIGGYQLQHKGSLIMSHRSERTFLLPSTRGKGLFKKLVKACHNQSVAHDSAFCWGATSAIKPFERAGFKGYLKWRKYYFLPTGGGGFASWIKSLTVLLMGLFNSTKPQGYESRLVLAGHVAGLLPSIGNACSVQVEEINFKTYALGIRNIANTNPNNDFDLLVSEGLLHWLSERAINLDCFVVTNRSGDVDGYFAIRIIEGCAILEDWHISPKCSESKFIRAMKKALRTGNKSSENPINSLIIALNTKNLHHQRMAKGIPKVRLSSQNVGAFVIKAALYDPDISKLRINPIWLEL